MKKLFIFMVAIVSIGLNGMESEVEGAGLAKDYSFWVEISESDGKTLMWGFKKEIVQQSQLLTNLALNNQQNWIFNGITMDEVLSFKKAISVVNGTYSPCSHENEKEKEATTAALFVIKDSFQLEKIATKVEGRMKNQCTDSNCPVLRKEERWKMLLSKIGKK